VARREQASYPLPAQWYTPRSSSSTGGTLPAASSEFGADYGCDAASPLKP
jgi:hypothetical protein